jgi:hypothetical protein
MRQLAIEWQASCSEYQLMTTNWISRLARGWATFFGPADIMPAEFVDRDAERVRRELELIRIRFPHHA